MLKIVLSKQRNPKQSYGIENIIVPLSLELLVIPNLFVKKQEIEFVCWKDDSIQF